MTRLCALEDIEDTGSAGMTAEIDGAERPLILVRRGEQVWAYVNSCPHIGLPLDFKPGWFLSLDRKFIHCANHGALFRIEDGVCVAGPCVRQWLTAVPVEIREGEVFLA